MFTSVSPTPVPILFVLGLSKYPDAGLPENLPVALSEKEGPRLKSVALFCLLSAW